MGAVNLLIFVLAGWLATKPRSVAFGDFMEILAPTGALIFGVAWFCSSWIKSPSNAAAAGLIAAITVPMTLAILSDGRNLTEDQSLSLYLTTCWALAPMFFVAGIVTYLRRVEP